MSITFGEAREILSKYAGSAGYCADSREVELFTKRVLQDLLFSGQYGNLKKACFCALKGEFTIPYEIEVIEKVAIDGVIGSAWSKWTEWHSPGPFVGQCYYPGQDVLEDPNYYPTVYPVPPGGTKIGALGTCEEACDAYLIVSGKDTLGREVVTDYKGEQVVGERISIKKGQLTYGNVVFSQVTGVVKPHTIGYVQLNWVSADCQKFGFLSEYSPLEEKPTYRRYKITSASCGNIAKVSVLGRIRLKDKYADTELIPFENYATLELTGQKLQAQTNRDYASAQAAEGFRTKSIEEENNYKRMNNGQPVEVFVPLSGGAIGNIVRGRLFRGGR